MGNGVELHWINVFGFLPLTVDRQNPIDRHGQNLAINTRLVVHFQNPDGAAGDHHTWYQRHGCDYQHIDGVTVT